MKPPPPQNLWSLQRVRHTLVTFEHLADFEVQQVLRPGPQCNMAKNMCLKGFEMNLLTVWNQVTLQQWVIKILYRFKNMGTRTYVQIRFFATLFSGLEADAFSRGAFHFFTWVDTSDVSGVISGSKTTLKMIESDSKPRRWRLVCLQPWIRAPDWTTQSMMVE